MPEQPPNTPARLQGFYHPLRTPVAGTARYLAPGSGVYASPTSSSPAHAQATVSCPTCGALTTAERLRAAAQQADDDRPEPARSTRKYTKRGPVKERVFKAMAFLADIGLDFSVFLHEVFSKNTFRYTETGKLSVADARSYAQKIGAFLRGRCQFPVATILELWLRHPSGLPNTSNEERGSLFSLTADWKLLKHARPALTSWAAQACRSELERETRAVIAPVHGLQAMIHTPVTRPGGTSSTTARSARELIRWSDLGETTISEAQNVFESVTPLLWGFLRQVAQKKRPATLRVASEYRPWNIVITGAIGQLLFCRRRTVNVLPLQRSLSFFAARASTIIYRIESRFANTTTYNTLLDGLRTAGNERIAAAASLARSAVRWYKLVFDNTQRYCRQHELRAGRENRMIKGSAGTVFEMIGFHPSASDLADKVRRIAAGHRYAATREKLLRLIDRGHWCTVRQLHWAQVLVDYIPELSDLRGPIAQLFDELVSKEPSAPPLQKTNVFNLRSNAADLSYTTGICNALDDFLVTQLGQAKPTETELPRLVIVGGDGATFEGMNRLKKQRQNHTHAFDRFEHVETELELWHACWTEINRFYGAHFGPAGSEDPSTLRASLVHINRPLPSDLKKVDFQSSLDNLMLVGHARMLDCWRVILGSHNLLRDFAEKKRLGTLPSLTEILITAGELSQTYSSIRAHEIATELRCDQPESHRVPANDDWVRLKTDAEIGEEEGFGGDRVLANAIAFLHDFITIREWRHATASGEIGRVYEVLKTVLFNFCGSDHNPRYFGYVLETILSLEYECSDALKHARLQNWLVNPSGLAGHYVEGDLAQEHYIKPLTAYSQRANAAYDGDFERNVLSPNLDNLVQLTRRMEAAVSLARRSQKHTSMHTDPEMRKLLAFYAEHDFHRFHIGNSFGHRAPLHYSRGVACMPAKLKKFLATHRAETDIFGQRWGTPHPEALQSPTFDETAVIPPDNDASAPPAPAAIVDGALLTLQLEVEQLAQDSNDVDAGGHRVDDGTAAAQGTGALGAPRVVSVVTDNQQEHQDASDEEDGGSEIEDTATGEESMAAKYWVGSDASDESDNDVEMTIE